MPYASSSSPQSVAIAATDCAVDEVTTKASGSNGAPVAASHVRRVMGTTTATLLVVASMVGTGVFTTTGLLLADVGSPIAVLVAWVIGGLIALFGALSYAELVAALPRNGGEYQLLSRIYHPAVGFVAGWVSLVVGFSAPIAASAIAFGFYLSVVAPALDALAAGVLLILALSLLHGVRVTLGSNFQNVFTSLKVVVVLAFIGGGLILGDPSNLSGDSFDSVLSSMTTPGFAIGLIFVSFAYSGWNGAAYIAGEVRDPDRSLPRALAFGTGIVTLLYLGLNVVFLLAAPTSALKGVIEVGNVAAEHLFGGSVGRALSGVIALLLVSSVSAMIMAGPRVYQAIGDDYPKLSLLRTRTNGSGPVYAIGVQACVAILMLVTSSFDALLTYIGFTLSLSAGLTVFGVFVLRRREPDLARPYRCWGYPVTPVLFLALSCWMVVFTLVAAPVVAAAGGCTVASGLVLYLLAGPRQPREASEASRK